MRQFGGAPKRARFKTSRPRIDNDSESPQTGAESVDKLESAPPLPAVESDEETDRAGARRGSETIRRRNERRSRNDRQRGGARFWTRDQFDADVEPENELDPRADRDEGLEASVVKFSLTTEKTGATDATSDGESSQGNGEEVQTTDEAIVSTAPTDGDGGASDGESNSTATDALDGETPASTPTTDEAGVATATGAGTDGESTSTAQSSQTLARGDNESESLASAGPVQTDASDGESETLESLATDELESDSTLPAESDEGKVPAREYFGDDFLVDLADKVARGYCKRYNRDRDALDEARQNAALCLLTKVRIDPSQGRERCVHAAQLRAFGYLIRDYQNANGLRRKEPPPQFVPVDAIDVAARDSDLSAGETRALDKVGYWREAFKRSLANLEVDEGAELEDLEARIAAARERVEKAEKRVETKKKLVCELERGARPLRRVKSKKGEEAQIFTIDKERELLEKQETGLASARKSLEKLVENKSRLVAWARAPRRIVRAIIDSQTTTDGDAFGGRGRNYDQIAAENGVSVSFVQRTWERFKEDCKIELQYSGILPREPGF